MKKFYVYVQRVCRSPIRPPRQGMYTAPIRLLTQGIISYHITAFRYLTPTTASGYYFLANDVMESGGCAQRLTLPEILGSLHLRCTILLLKVMRQVRSLGSYAIFFFNNENENTSYKSCHTSAHQSNKNNFCLRRMSMFLPTQ